jgi:hypothetical protein
VLFWGYRGGIGRLRVVLHTKFPGKLAFMRNIVAR